MIDAADRRTAWFKRPTFAEMNLVIWRNGGRWERFFLSFGYFTAALLVSVVLLMFWWFWIGALRYEVLLSLALAALTYGAFHNALSTGIINSRVWRHYLNEGRLRPHEGYFREWIRFIENEGDRGLFPGAVRWSIALWAIYYGTLPLAVLFTLSLQPTFKEVTPLLFAALDAFVVFLAWTAWHRHVRAVDHDMDRKGYRLSEYAKAAGWTPASQLGAGFKLVPRTRREVLRLFGALVALALAIALAYAFVSGVIRLGYP